MRYRKHDSNLSKVTPADVAFRFACMAVHDTIVGMLGRCAGVTLLEFDFGVKIIVNGLGLMLGL